MYESKTQVRVRYAETDQMGYVYYGNYLTYYEVARVECLRQIGVVYKDLEGMGIMMPVRESHSTYIAPAKYDELLTIVTQVPEMPTAKMKFRYKVLNEVDEVIHKGETVLVFVAMETGRLCRCPEAMKTLLLPHFNEQ